MKRVNIIAWSNGMGETFDWLVFLTAILHPVSIQQALLEDSM